VSIYRMYPQVLVGVLPRQSSVNNGNRTILKQDNNGAATVSYSLHLSALALHPWRMNRYATILLRST
jgi:hypothetical protein